MYEMYKKLERRFKLAVTVVLMLMVVGISIKFVHDEVLRERSVAQAAQEDKAYKEFFAWRDK